MGVSPEDTHTSHVEGVQRHSVTRPITVNDVFHFPETLCFRKKKAVAATMPIEMSQRSSQQDRLRLPSAAKVDGSPRK